MDSIPTVTVPLDTLEQFCREAAARMGVPPDDAEIFVDVLLSGSLRSLPGQGQGVQQLPTYYERIKTGVVDVDARLRDREPRTAASRSRTHTAASVRWSRRRRWRSPSSSAGEQGIGAVGVRDSTHFGIAAYYAMLALAARFHRPRVQQRRPGDRALGRCPEPVVGTNPWAVAVPAGSEWPVVLDLANSTSGKGMIGWYLRRGPPIPDDWALTADGRTDHRRRGRASAGTLFPLGGAKGYGMAVVVDALDRRADRIGVRPRLLRRRAGRTSDTSCRARHLPLRPGRGLQDADGRPDRPDPLVAAWRPGSTRSLCRASSSTAAPRSAVETGVPIEAGRFDALAALGHELGVPTHARRVVAHERPTEVGK